LLHDLFPSCVAATGLDNKPVADLLEEALSRYRKKTDPPELSYFILGTPRSGSHFLCDLLRSVGFGEPKEHIKRPFKNAWNKRTEWNFDARIWFENLIRTGQVDGVFGTKIVHTIDVVKIQEETGLFSSLFHKGIYLTRRDRVLQAISLYRAEALNYWHDRGAQGERGVLEYSFDRILKAFKYLLSHEEKFEAGLKLIPTPIQHVAYEDLTADPEGTMKAMSEFLGDETADLTRLGSREKKIGTAREEEMGGRFAIEYRQRFGKECPRFGTTAPRSSEHT
jgi:LPS sulfotransferase NodH